MVRYRGLYARVCFRVGPCTHMGCLQNVSDSRAKRGPRVCEYQPALPLERGSSLHGSPAQLAPQGNRCLASTVMRGRASACWGEVFASQNSRPESALRAVRPNNAVLRGQRIRSVGRGPWPLARGAHTDLGEKFRIMAFCLAPLSAEAGRFAACLLTNSGPSTGKAQLSMHISRESMLRLG